MNKKNMIQSALAGVVALGLSSAASVANAADKGDMEKCYGVVKAKMNDCGTASHSCAGQASKDNDASEWVFLPKGSCDKLVNGSTTAGGGDKTDAPAS